MLNLDTHMLVALVTGDVSPAELACVVNQPLAISDIVLWELAILVRKRPVENGLREPRVPNMVAESRRLSH